MTIDPSISLRFTGTYSLAASVGLAASAAFVDDLYRTPDHEEGVLDLAFPLDGSWRAVGVRIAQQDNTLRAHILANPDAVPVETIRAQLESILSLDVDGTNFVSAVAHDHIAADLVRQHPGVLPVLFPSPYEAAARTIIGHQLPIRQAVAIARRLANEYGVRVQLPDHELWAFPAPEQLAQLPAVRGLAARKVEQLRMLGSVALSGQLTRPQLRALGREQASSALQELPGIGPFSAELVWMRGVGDADAFPIYEQRLHRAMAVAYRAGDTPAPGALEQLADQWRPFRNWVGLLLRNSIDR